MAATRTVFIDTALSNHASLAAHYDAAIFDVVLLDDASPHAGQIRNWLNSHDAAAASMNIVSASTSVNGSFSTRVVFVDPSVADIDTVIAGVPANATVVVLDAGRDGVQQIQDYLAANAGQVAAIDIITDLASVDVVSHGAPGEVVLGSTVLSADNLAAYGAQLAAIGSHLTAGGDVLLYGCDVASGSIGQDFISALAAATGADVAASTDLTGSEAAGGDWALEASTGTIETAALNIAEYEGVLDAATSITSAIVLSHDTGASPTDFITRTASQTFTGTFNASTNNSQIPTIYVSTDGSGQIRKAATVTYTDNAGSGSFTVTVDLLPLDAQNPANRSIQFWSGSGGNNAISPARAYTLDTAAPTKGVNTIVLSNDTGASSSDLITSAAAQTVSGTLSAGLGEGEVVRVSLDNGVTWRTAATAIGQNTFSLSGVTLTASNTLKVQVEDAAGNAGPARSAAYVLDTITAAGTLSFSNLIDSGTTGDGVTKDNSFDLALTGNEAGASVVYEVASNGGAFATTAAAQANLADGNYQFRARVTDVAGNTATTNTVGVTVDATAPGAPTITGFADNSGSSGDTVTNDATPTLTISAEADSTVYVLKNGVPAGIANQTAPGSGIYTFTPPALAEGSYSFTATVTDAAGNASTASAAQAIVVDSTPPAAPSITGFSDNSGADGDNLTNDKTPTLTISAEADSTVEIFKDGVSVGTATQTAVRGTYAFTSAVLADGGYSFTAKARDAAGNSSNASSAQAIVVDSTPPAAPSITGFSDNSGADGDNLTNDKTPTLTISAEADSTVEIFKDGVSVGTATQTAVRGTYAFTSAVLADGGYSFTAKAMDVAGNSSNASAAQAIVVDTMLTTPTLALAIDSGTNGSDRLTKNAALNFSTPDEAVVRVISVNGTVVDNYDAAALTDGEYTVTVLDTDRAANSADASVTFTLDRTGPAFISGTSASVAENVGANHQVYQSQATDAHAFAYSLDGADAARFNISAAGAVTLKDNPDFESAKVYQFSVVATDAAGNKTDRAVSLGVTNVNEAPTPSASSMSTIENAAISFQAGDVAADPDAGDTHTLTLSATSATLSWAAATTSTQLINPVTKAPVDLTTLNVKTILSADGTTVTLTPPAELDWMVSGQVLKATITYTVRDAGGLTGTSSMTLLINGSTNDKGVNLNGGNGNDTLAGSTSTNAEDVIQGGNGNDILSGHGGTDALYGDNGDDSLVGGAGIDYLYGDSGNDTLYGGSEGDYLFGGKGNDILRGDAGADRFVFDAQGGADRIEDFKLADGDKLFFANLLSTMSANDFISKYVRDTGDDLLISMPGASIVLVGVLNVDGLAGALGFGPLV